MPRVRLPVEVHLHVLTEDERRLDTQAKEGRLQWEVIMIAKSNQHFNDRELSHKKGVRFCPPDVRRIDSVAHELGLNDRRSATGFAEFVRLAALVALKHAEDLRKKDPEGWRDRVLNMLGVDPNDIYPE